MTKRKEPRTRQKKKRTESVERGIKGQPPDYQTQEKHWSSPASLQGGESQTKQTLTAAPQGVGVPWLDLSGVGRKM